MCSQYTSLCSLILLEYFGETVEKVGKDLLRCGQKPLRFIIRDTQVSVNKVRQALCILIKYGLVSFETGKIPDVAEYKIHPEKVMVLLRFPKYLILMKTKFGDEAEIIVEEILKHGICKVSQILIDSYQRCLELKSMKENNSTSIVSLRDTFETLVNKHYIMRCPTPVDVSLVPKFIIDSSEEFKPPKVDVPALAECLSGKNVNIDDGNVYWRVNIDRFHQDMRDDLLILAMTRRINADGGEVFRLIIKQMYFTTQAWSSVSGPIIVSELKDLCRKSKMDSKIVKNLDEYLFVMAEDNSNFISKCLTTANLSYQVNIKTAIEKLTWCLLSSTVEGKFGVHAARIFRLINEEKFIQQDDIQKKAMLPDKEAKLLTYTLLQTGWIQQQELRKGLLKSGPSKTFYLFHIDVNNVVRMNIEACYKSLYNAISRREHEKLENKSLLDKKQRIDAITLHMKNEGATDEQITEVEEMITPPEHNLLEKIQSTVNKLSQAELQIDETLFILQLYLAYQVD